MTGSRSFSGRKMKFLTAQARMAYLNHLEDSHSLLGMQMKRRRNMMRREQIESPSPCSSCNHKANWTARASLAASSVGSARIQRNPSLKRKQAQKIRFRGENMGTIIIAGFQKQILMMKPTSRMSRTRLISRNKISNLT